jgi:sarcosine oxidase
MRLDWDVIVVGLGAFGSAAAYWASTRPGVRVLGIERFELGHANGASAGELDAFRIDRPSLLAADPPRTPLI